MIPPGVHFVHWNAVNTVHSQVGPRSGFFQDFAAGECVVKRSVLGELGPKWNLLILQRKTDIVRNWDKSCFVTLLLFPDLCCTQHF